MYYPESSNLISSHSARSSEIGALDALIAHAYRADGHGYIEGSDASHAASISVGDAEAILRLFVTSLQEYTPVECCGERQDPATRFCVHGHCDLGAAPDSLPNRFRIVTQPQDLPPINPAVLRTPDCMLSYRHGDSGRLATDLYYHLTRRGHNVFYDKPGILGGVDWERVFCQAASSAPVILFLRSPDYFGSIYCKKELAHAARAGRRILAVPCGGPPDSSDLPWLGTVQSIRIDANPLGLTPDVRDEIDQQLAIRCMPTDHKVEGCQFLLNSLSAPDLTSVCTKLPFLRDINVQQDRRLLVNAIVNEAHRDPSRVHQLCTALAP